MVVHVLLLGGGSLVSQSLSKIYHKIIDFVCLGRCGREINCAVVWEDVDIKVIHSSGRCRTVFLHYVVKRINSKEMLH